MKGKLTSIVLKRTYEVLGAVGGQEDHVGKLFASYYGEKEVSVLSVLSSYLFSGERLVSHLVIAFYGDAGYPTCPDKLLEDIYDYLSGPAVSVAMREALWETLMDILRSFPEADRAELLEELKDEDKKEFGVSIVFTTVLWYAICEDYYLSAAAA